MNKILIMGELHTDEERTRVNNYIKSKRFFNRHPRILLLEDLEDVKLTYPTKLFRPGIRYDRSVVERLKLANYLRADPIGIDLNSERNRSVYKDDVYENDKVVSLVRSFALREIHMLAMIKYYRDLGDCIVIMGDTHLRTKETPELGPPSPIYLEYSNDLRVEIIRSPIHHSR